MLLFIINFIATNSVVSCNKISNGFTIKNFIDCDNLYNEKKRLYEDDTLVCGVYLRIYKKKPQSMYNIFIIYKTNILILTLKIQKIYIYVT